MDKKFVKKLFIVAMVLTMVFAMSATSFAATGTATVKFYLPEPTTVPNVNYSIPFGYQYDSSVELYKYEGSVNLADITTSSVSLPTGFVGAFNTNPNATYVPTAFDAIYNLAVTQRGENPAIAYTPEAANAQFTYGFDMFNTPNGIYIGKLSGYDTIPVDTYYSNVAGDSYWKGYSWSFYAVPIGAIFNPSIGEHDDTYLSNYYTSNIEAQANYTYYMIFEYNEVYW